MHGGGWEVSWSSQIGGNKIDWYCLVLRIQCTSGIGTYTYQFQLVVGVLVVTHHF